MSGNTDVSPSCVRWPLLSARHLSEADCGHSSGVQCRQGISPSQVRSQHTQHTLLRTWDGWFGLAAPAWQAWAVISWNALTHSSKSESLSRPDWAPGPGAEEGNTGDRDTGIMDADFFIAQTILSSTFWFRVLLSNKVCFGYALSVLKDCHFQVTIKVSYRTSVESCSCSEKDLKSNYLYLCSYRTGQWLSLVSTFRLQPRYE